MNPSITSDIWGVGYGSNHRWEKRFTINDKSLPSHQRYIHYRCKVCNLYHSHFFDVIPDIFSSMKRAVLPEECSKEAADKYYKHLFGSR
jgi:hypothetical protein